MSQAAAAVALPNRTAIVAQVLQAAHTEWQRSVKDGTPAGNKIIDLYRRGSSGMGWTWDSPYLRNDPSKPWCGAFLAWCLSSAGCHWKIRRDCCPSTERLYDYGRYETDPKKMKGPPVACNKVRVADEPARPIKAWHEGLGSLRAYQDVRPGKAIEWAPEPGDIALVRTRGAAGSDWGDHVALVRGVDLDRGVVLTVEGNASGIGVGGGRYEGVVHGERDLPTKHPTAATHVRTVIRPSLADFLGSVQLL